MDKEIIAVGTECPLCGGTFYAPEPKYSKMIQQLARVVRAARTHLDTDGDDEGEMLEEALEALPEHLKTVDKR